MSSAGLAPAAHIKLHGIMPATIGNVLKSSNPLNQGMKKNRLLWIMLETARKTENVLKVIDCAH